MEQQYRAKNPIEAYQRLSGLTYAEMARRSHLAKQTIYDHSILPIHRLGQVRLVTVYKLKKYLGIDLLAFYGAVDKTH